MAMYARGDLVEEFLECESPVCIGPTRFRPYYQWCAVCVVYTKNASTD
jgi:hypothetical protein